MFFYNNSVSVIHRALMERLYYVKSAGGEFVPCPRPTRPYSDLNYFSRLIKRNMPFLPPAWTNDEFVASYTGSKAKRYACAAANLARSGVRKSYGYLKTFIKGEFYDATAKADPCPRLIQPRSAEYNVLVGRYLRPVEKLIYKAIDRIFGHHVVLKCDTPWKRASVIGGYWREFANPVFVGFDASRFDQHTSAEALRWEHEIYDSIFNSAELREYLGWQVNNVGYATCKDGTMRYTVEGCRMSGDMNTALGNVLIMCALCHKYLTEVGVRYRFIDDGDDCGVIVDAKDLAALNELPSHHLAYGYEMTVEKPAYRLEDIEFCQSRVIDCGNGNLMMVRNIHKALKQDAVAIDKFDWAEMQDVLAATGVCGLALYEGMPVLSEFYRMLATAPSCSKNVVKIVEEHRYGPRTWRSVVGARGFPIDEVCARVSIYRAFGILPDMQRSLEDEFRAQSLSYSTPESTPHNTLSTDRIQYYKYNG
nr:MAG: RNA-dependent RNA polymerase [Chemarfal virus 276]